ncbi:MAG TPA: 50S ribosomal protein L13 [Bacteroidales bacterium]
MNTLSYKTISVNKATAQKEWVIVDAQNQALGRLSSKVAKLLRGKYKPSYTPHVDCGDNVIVINADKVRLTGKKWTDREHFSHTGYQGGQVVLSPMDIFKKNPCRLIEKSVKGMLPKNILSNKLIGNLYVYVGENHKHEGQQPKSIDINSLK